jgi:hypothetical protein
MEIRIYKKKYINGTLRVLRSRTKKLETENTLFIFVIFVDGFVESIWK